MSLIIVTKVMCNEEWIQWRWLSLFVTTTN